MLILQRLYISAPPSLQPVPAPFLRHSSTFGFGAGALVATIIATRSSSSSNNSKHIFEVQKNIMVKTGPYVGHPILL